MINYCIRSLKYRRSSINLRTGSHIHHPQHGLGKIESIRKRSFAGQAEDTYMQVFFEREALTVIARADDISREIRKPISANEARKLLDRIKSFNEKVKTQWKARADSHQTALDSGDPLECAKVLKNLIRLESEGKLRQTDRDHLKHALEMLTDELSTALGKRRSHARRLITEAAGA